MKSMTHHEGVSERTLEIALAITLGIIVITVSRLVTGSSAWIGFSAAFCGLCFAQGRFLSRSYVVQVPFLVICAIKEPLLGTLFFLTYAIFTILSTRVSVRRLSILLSSDLITYGLFALSMNRLAPELWLFAGFAYVSLRTLCSSLLANKTGMPLDIGTISGTWAFISTQAFVSTGVALFYFEKTEVTQTLLFTLVGVSAMWLCALYMYQKAHAEFGKGVVALSGLLNYSHVYTGSHSRRVAYLARETGRRLRIAEWKLDHLVQAALLHDIGKIAVSEKILEKPGKLTDEEFVEIKKHPATGQRIVANLSELKLVSYWIRHHHERVDGNGYPDKLDKKKIPVESHVISVIDAYDAMTGHSADGHRRLYRDPISSDDAIAELKRCSGTQFDPRIVKHFVRVIEERKERLL
jgi:putative nucleotidyltransferase with HDIG domain